MRCVVTSLDALEQGLQHDLSENLDGEWPREIVLKKALSIPCARSMRGRVPAFLVIYSQRSTPGQQLRAGPSTQCEQHALDDQQPCLIRCAGDYDPRCLGWMCKTRSSSASTSALPASSMQPHLTVCSSS